MEQTNQSSETCAFLGIGTMGHGMAASALRAGIRTVVWNREGRRTEDLAAIGSEVAPTAADAAAHAGIVVTMVTDADAVMSIATEQGMLDAVAPDAIWVQMSTIGVAGIDRVAALVKGRRPDVTLLDAPVSGSKEPAEKGQLTIFASGPDDARARVAPLFDALGQRTVWVGRLGAGSRMKLVNNALLAFKAEGLATSIALGDRLGLDVGTMVDALAGGPLVSAWDTAKLQRIANDEYSAQFALALALKDVHLALTAVDDHSFEAFDALAREWERAVDQRLGDQDITVITRLLEGELV